LAEADGYFLSESKIATNAMRQFGSESLRADLNFRPGPPSQNYLARFATRRGR